MLYDPKWQKQATKADPLSLAALIAWLERCPSEETYDAFFADRCLLARWLQSADPSARTSDGAAHSFAYTFKGSQISLRHLNPVVFGLGGYTFGAALARARKLAAIS